LQWRWMFFFVCSAAAVAGGDFGADRSA
jgi:hypothetical protein